MTKKVISRRNFIKQSSAIGGLIALGSLSSRTFAMNSKIPIGLQLYSVRADCAKDFPGTVEKVAKMGYKGVEFAGYYDRTAKELRKMLDSNGLQCCGTHTSLDTLLGDEFEKTVEFHKILGNKYLIVPSMPQKLRGSIEDWKKLADIFNELAAKTKEHGMVVGYHNHDFEFKKINGETPWDAFWSNADKEVVMQLDTGNASHGGADPIEIFRKYPGRTLTVHLKAYSASKKKYLVGEDDIDWKVIFDLCETKGGTEWYIVEEEKDVYPPLEGVQRTLTNLKKMGKW